MPLPPTTGNELLIIYEEVSESPVTLAYVDHSHRLHFGDGAGSLGGSERTNFGSILKSRGTANIAINIPAGDSYMPTIGSQVFLYDKTPSEQTIIFAGTIDKIQTSWWGQNGDRLAALSCTSFEQVFGSIRVPGRLYTRQSAGQIFTDLMQLATGWPGTTGTIHSGETIDTFLVEGEPTLANLFDKLAALSSYVWSVDIGDLSINFGPPGITPAPFSLEQAGVLWEAVDYQQDRHDFRDRQIITLDYDAFGRSDEVFVGAGQTAFTLRNPVHQVTNAWITKNTQNTATGSFSGQPSVGDKVTISYPKSGSIYNWSPNSPYAAGQVIIDPHNHRQVCTTAGTSAGAEPPWNDIGGETVDGTVRWKDSGAVGFGPYQSAVYTFVDTIDNTQFGQVLIGATAAETCQNLIDAINSQTETRGVNYSLPTWENPLVDADAPSGTTFTLRNKYAGQGFIAALSKTGTAFSWSAAQTSGGITTFGTYALAVGISTAQSRALSYTPGSAVVTLDSPLNAGTNLAVEYQRIDGNAIAVENTPLVGERATIEAGTGKYQALTSDNSATPTQALAEAVAALQAFETIPSTLEFITLKPGLRVNQGLTVDFTMPDGPDLTVGQTGGAYGYRRKIHVNATGANLAQFPMLFAGTYSWLANVAHGGQVNNVAGFDIVFAGDANNTVPVNWEIQSYDPVTGAVVFWVKVDEIDSVSGADIWIFYGNASVSTFQSAGNPWEPGQFVGVYHMTESGGPFIDSSTYGNDSTGGVPPTLATGPFGAAQSFDGSTNYIKFSNPVTGNAQSIGFSFWLKTTASSAGLADNGGGGSGGGSQALIVSGDAVSKDVHANFSVAGAPINDGSWHYVQCFDHGFGAVSVLVDGAEVDLVYLGAPVNFAGDMFLGCLRGLTNFYGGLIAEFRVLKIVPLDPFLQAEYSNQSNPSGFYSIGPPDTFDQAPWIVQEVEGELIPSSRSLGDEYGFWRYTVRCINVAQIGSYIDFWLGLGSGGDGGGSSSYSGSPTPPSSSAAGVEVGKNGTIIGSEPEINLIEGTNITLTVTDDPANQKVDVTINSSASGIGGVNAQTASYTILTGDNGKLVTFTSSTAVTALLPSSPPASPWVVLIENRGTGILTVNPNGNNLDGAGSSLQLGQGQGLVIYSSGSAYFAMRGLAAGAQSPGKFWGVPSTASGSTPPGFVSIGSGDLPPANAVLLVKKYVQNFTGVTSATLTHNFGSTAVVVQVYDSGSGIQVEPETVTVTDANNIVVTFGASFTGYAVVLGTGAYSGNTVYQASWTSQTSVTVTHNLGTTSVSVQVFDSGGLKVLPETVTITSSNVITLTFGAAFSGSVVVIAAPGAIQPLQSYTTSWTSQTSVTVTHDLNTSQVIVQVFDSSGLEVMPESLTITSTDVVTLTFGAAFTGSVVVIG